MKDHTLGDWGNPGAHGEPQEMFPMCRVHHELRQVQQGHVIANKIHKVQNGGGGG
jgi:hypothetical protein